MRDEDNNLSALQELIRSGEFRNSQELGKKTEGRVFDKRTLLHIYHLMKSLEISTIDFPIASGKESVVFRARMGKTNIAIKIYKMSTLKFNRVEQYISGDPRFEKERRDRSRIVYLWAKKEFANLTDLHSAGISAPAPIALKGNVLVMKYIGTGPSPAPLLKQYNPDPEDTYRQVRTILRDMYVKAKLVHADFSEYNLLYHRKKVFVIDVGQSVSLKHPGSLEFLKRDVKNITSYFMRMGVSASEDELLNFVIKNE